MAFDLTQSTPATPVTPAAGNKTAPTAPSGIMGWVSGLFGGQKTAPQPDVPAATPAPKPSGFNLSTKTQPKQTGGFDLSTGNKNNSQYFYKKFDSGATIGTSDKNDTMGKPLVGYRNPGDKATTTDMTRVATTFDPTVAQKLDRKTFDVKRDPNVTKMRGAFGASYNQELDHKISLELSGSNETDNLAPETAVDSSKKYGPGNPTPTDALENKLAAEVASGKKSLMDAQVELSKAKGNKAPWTPPSATTSPVSDAWEGFKSSVKNLFATPVEAATIDQETPAKIGKFDLTQKPAVTPIAPQPPLSLAAQALAMKDSSTINAPGQKNVLKSTAVPDKFKGQTISQKVTPEDPWYVAAGKAAMDTVTGTLKDTGKRLSDYTYSLMGLSGDQNEKGQMASTPTEEQIPDRVLKGMSAGAGIINAVFTATGIPSAFKAGEHIPFIAPAAKFVGTVMEDIGKVVAPNAALIVNALPMTDETKTEAIPVVTELLTILAQAAAGKVAHDIAAPKVVALTQDIKSLARDSFIKATKDKTTIVTPAGNVFIHPDTIRDYIAGRKITDQEATDLYKTLGRTADQIRKDVKDGVNIEVPAKTIELLKDKPYWSAIKDLFAGRVNGEPIPNAQGGFVKNPLVTEETAPSEVKGKETTPTPSDEKKTILEPYKPSGDLTIKTLDKLKGRSTVSKQFISDLTNSGDLKQAERDTIRRVLSDYPDGKDVPVKEFAEKVQGELLPLDRNGLVGTSYKNITLPSDVRGNIADYSEHVYNSPIKTSAGNVHFSNAGPKGATADGYFAHTRIEDLAAPETKRYLGDIASGDKSMVRGVSGKENLGDTRRVIELQSDLFQKGRLEKEAPHGEDVYPSNFKEAQKLRDREARREELTKLEPYRNTWFERVIREEIKQAAKDGKTKLQFPTGETAMKIEGLGQQNHSWTIDNGTRFGDPLTAEKLEVGKEIDQGNQAGRSGHKWIITDVLGDGKFKAVSKQLWDGGKEGWSKNKTLEETAKGFAPALKEQFDISGKVDQNNPIYKFYESTVAKYLKKFGAKTITDAQGVTWNEIDVPKTAAKAPIQAYKNKPIFSELNGPRISKNQAFDIIQKASKEAGIPINVLFTKKFIDKVATGKYTIESNGFKDEVKHLITLYEEGGKVGMNTVNHEVGHFFFNNILTDVERDTALKVAEENIGLIKKAGYMLDGYKHADILEEYLMDEYARQKKEEAGFKGPFKKIMEMIDRALKKLSETVKDIGDRLNKAFGGDIKEGRQGGFIKNPLAEEPEEKLAAAKKVLEEAEKKRGVEPTEVALDKKGDFAEREAANKKYVSTETREQMQKAHTDAVAEVKADPDLEELKQRKAILEEILDNHPAVGLIKYTNKATGELPEVTGEGNTLFGRNGDDMATELGFKDSEQARASVSEVRDLQRQIKDINQEIQEKKLDIRDKVKALQDDRSMGGLVARSEKHISDLLAKQERMLKTREAAEEGAAKTKAEEEKKATLQDKINKAKAREIKRMSFLGKIKQTFFPVRALDAQTHNIVLDWYQAKAEATEKAQATWKEMKLKGPQNFKAITDYQAGGATPYIREALDSLGTQAHRAGLSFEYRENYLPQVYRQRGASVMDAVRRRLMDQGMQPGEIEAYLNGQELTKDQSLRLKLRPNFVKERFFPDYKTAMKYGLTPKYNTPAELIAYYHEALENSIANKNFIETLRSEAKLLPDEDRPDSWQHVSTRFTGRQTLYAPPVLADFLNGIFRDEENLSLGLRGLRDISKVFHGIQHLVLSTGVPFSTLHSFGFGVGLAKPLTTAGGLIAEAPLRAVFGDFRGSLGKLQEAGTMLKQSIAFFRANSTTLSNRFMEAHTDDLVNMARQGIALPMRRDVYSRAVETYKKVLIDFKGDITGPVPQAFKAGGLVGTGKAISTTGSAMLRVWNKVFTEKTYDMIGQQTVQIFGDTLRAAKRSGLEDEDAAKLAAEVTRAFMGISEVPESGRGKTLREMITAGLMAPFYREGVVNVLINSVRGSSSQWRNPSYSLPRGFLIGAALSYVLYNILNKKLNGYYLWDNPPGREFSLRIPNGNGAMYTEILPSVLTIPRNIMEGGIALAHGDIDTAKQKVASVLSIPVSTIYNAIFSGKDYFGRDIYNAADTPGVKAEKVGMYLFGNSVSPMVNEAYKYFTGQESLIEALVRGFAAPLKFTSAISENYNLVQKIYNNNQKLKAAGKTDEANGVYDALPDGQKLIYNDIKRQAAAAQTVRTKASMEKLYANLQQMKSEGNVDGANAIYYGLSQEEQHVYDLIKRAANKRATESQ